MSERIERIRSHIEAKLTGVSIDPSPFPHVIVPDFFPGDVFREILRLDVFRVSEGTEWLTRKKGQATRTPTPYHARRQINFHDPKVLPGLPPEHRDFWSDVSGVFLAGDWFPALVTRLYRPYFDIRFGDAQHLPGFYGLFRRECFLQRHRPGYFIGPHSDVPQRVFTCIFSFADRSGFDEYGTQLLEPRDPLQRCHGHDHHPQESFRVVKIAPYRPNSFLLFFKTRQSFHAVREIAPAVPNGRYGMQFQFYETGDGVFQELSKPVLFRNTRIAARDERSRGSALLHLARARLRNALSPWG